MWPPPRCCWLLLPRPPPDERPPRDDDDEPPDFRPTTPDQAPSGVREGGRVVPLARPLSTNCPSSSCRAKGGSLTSASHASSSAATLAAAAAARAHAPAALLLPAAALPAREGGRGGGQVGRVGAVGEVGALEGAAVVAVGRRRGHHGVVRRGQVVVGGQHGRPRVVLLLLQAGAVGGVVLGSQGGRGVGRHHLTRGRPHTQTNSSSSHKARRQAAGRQAISPSAREQAVGGYRACYWLAHPIMVGSISWPGRCGPPLIM